VKRAIAALAAGALFGLGLATSGMTQPAKVQSFLDVTGRWDPTLAFVMIGALAVHFVLYRVVRRRRAPLFDSRFHVPTRRDVDLRLTAGAILFGVGWGLSGQCPGPAIANLATVAPTALVFVGTMIAGMVLQRFLEAARPPISERAGSDA
jgi:uncharacterized membrane protein YedE/YeeE